MDKDENKIRQNPGQGDAVQTEDQAGDTELGDQA